MNFFDSFLKTDNDLKKMNFSLEIGPKTEVDVVPALSDVYITMLPGGDYKETAEKASELVRKGFNPVPHFQLDRCKMKRNSKIMFSDVRTVELNKF